MVKVGRLLLVSHGAYSSYTRLAWFIAVQDFSPDALLAEYLAENANRAKPYGGFASSEFLTWVIRKGVIAEVEEFFDEWHLGDYGSASEVAFWPRHAHQTSASQEPK